MDRLHLKYVMLNKNNVWYRLYYNYATLHAPTPSLHNKSYDSIDIGGLVVWLTYTQPYKFSITTYPPSQYSFTLNIPPPLYPQVHEPDITLIPCMMMHL